MTTRILIPLFLASLFFSGCGGGESGPVFPFTFAIKSEERAAEGFLVKTWKLISEIRHGGKSYIPTKVSISGDLVVVGLRPLGYEDPGMAVLFDLEAMAGYGIAHDLKAFPYLAWSALPYKIGNVSLAGDKVAYCAERGEIDSLVIVDYGAGWRASEYFLKPKFSEFSLLEYFRGNAYASLFSCALDAKNGLCHKLQNLNWSCSNTPHENFDANGIAVALAAIDDGVIYTALAYFSFENARLREIAVAIDDSSDTEHPFWSLRGPVCFEGAVAATVGGHDDASASAIYWKDGELFVLDNSELEDIGFQRPVWASLSYEGALVRNVNFLDGKRGLRAGTSLWLPFADEVYAFDNGRWDTMHYPTALGTKDSEIYSLDLEAYFEMNDNAVLKLVHEINKKVVSLSLGQGGKFVYILSDDKEGIINTEVFLGKMSH